MFTKGLSRWFFITALTGALALLAIWTVPAQAQFSTTDQAEPKCLSCHDDLYFLHDTGKWFCLNEETPMTCVGCHGGDPVAITKEAAHIHRATHPIINENASKCSECHPEQSSERIKTFALEAGTSLVKVSLPYQPSISSAEAQPILATARNAQISKWIPAVAGVLLILVAGLVLTIYILFRVYRNGNVRP
jgi:hypothetical protein